MWFIPAITAILAGLAVALFTPVITAQTPQLCPVPIPPGQTPPPSPVLVPCPTPAPAAAPRTVSIPGEVTLTSPGEPVIFRRPSDGASLTVFFGGGSGPASLTYDGAVLTARVPPLGAFEFLTGGDNCARPDGESHVLRCAVQPTIEGERLPIGIVHGDPIYPFRPSPSGGLSVVPLEAGCTNVALTFPNGTPVDAIARSVIGPGTPLASRVSPESVWKFEPADRRFLGWSPLASSPDDFTHVDHLDAVFICVGTAAQLVQPAPVGGP